jgi:hypothetical protein
MAQKLSLTDAYGNTYPEAYRKLSTLILDVIDRTGRVGVLDYKDQTARHDPALRPFHAHDVYLNRDQYATFAAARLIDLFPAVAQLVAAVPAAAGVGNLTLHQILGTAIYQHLKTLPEAAQAVDVLESETT